MIIPKPGKRRGEIIRGWEKKTWDMASLFVRARDASEGGYCRCISCGSFHHWKSVDAGHYIKRKHTAIWLNEININSQCIPCNRGEDGNVANYRVGLVMKYDEQTVLLLEASKGFKKWDDWELMHKFEDFKSRFKKLKREKGL